MTARMRTALLAVVASLGLVSLAYGMGGMVGGGSSSAAGGGSPSGASSAPSYERLVDASDDPGTRRHRGPCKHRHDGGGGGSNDDSSTSAPTADSY